MRVRWALVFLAALVACGGPRPPPPAPPAAPEPAPAEPAPPAPSSEPPPPVTATTDAAERARPPSTASYEQALATPETVDLDDEHPHLTDAQLTSPMNGVLTGCYVPRNAKITIKTAVQFGRAVGVTVDVHLDKPKPKPPPKPTKRARPAQIRAEKAQVAAQKTEQKAEQKAIAKLAACVDRNVRAVVWPPNRRRDSFTMEL